MQPRVYLPFGDLEKAVFIERPNRFLVRCKLDNSDQVVEAHLADPGRLIELLQPGRTIYLRYVNKPTRKTQWSVILVETEDEVLVSLQSTLVNELASEALQKQAIPELGGWEFVRSEFTLAGSRWDFLLQDTKQKKRLVEVKSCNLVQDGVAMFPDAVTARGRRHVLELVEWHKKQEYATTILFVVQRKDAKLFRPADHIDPAFGQALRKAAEGGVMILARKSIVTLAGIELGDSLPIDLT